MKKCALASVFLIALTASAFGAEKFFVVKDTVNNCSVVEGGASAGLTPIENTDGYDSEDAAMEALKTIRDSDQCAGVVE